MAADDPQRAFRNTIQHAVPRKVCRQQDDAIDVTESNPLTAMVAVKIPINVPVRFKLWTTNPLTARGSVYQAQPNSTPVRRDLVYRSARR